MKKIARNNLKFCIIMILLQITLSLLGCSSNKPETSDIVRNSQTAETSKIWSPSDRTDSSAADDSAGHTDSSAADDSAGHTDSSTTDDSAGHTDSSTADEPDSSANADPDNGLKALNPGNVTPTPLPKPFTIVLDPGHGGIFSGAVHNDLVEKNLTLRVAQYAKQYLETNYPNITVYLTREDDSEMSGDIVEDLELRAEFAKEKKADALISLHFNASDGHDACGATVYISRRDNVNSESELLAESILQQLLGLGLERKGVLTRKSNDMFDANGEAYDYYAINRHCANRDLKGIIVEHCFMDNATDISYIDSEEKLQMLGEADARGIAEYLMP